MACRSGCPTQDHSSYAECCRDMGMRIAYARSAQGWDYTKQKKWDAELDAYKAARKEGLSPKGTSMRDIDNAKRIADMGGD